MPAKRILLMYISLGSGHHCASLAVENALRELEPQAEVLNVESVSYMNPVLGRIIYKTYVGMIKNTPEVWDYLYDNPKVLKGTQRLRQSIHKYNSGKLKVLFDEFRPDVIGCTQAFPCGVVADYKRSFGVAIPLVGILTDYAPHSYWLFESVDIFIVASQQAKVALIQNGISEDKIKVFGIPIDLRFKRNGSREEVLGRLGLDPSIPSILVMGGSQGMGPVKEIVWSLNRSRSLFQIIVVAGKNRSLLSWLIRKMPRYRKKVAALGYVDNVDELMGISSLVITKPGGMTTAEALSKNLPIIILNPIPGQEDRNAQFLIREGAAVKAKDGQEVTVLVEELLNYPGKLDQMRTQAARHARPYAARETARLLLEL